MMKKIFLLAVLVVMTIAGKAQNSAEDLFNAYKDRPKVEYVHVPKMMMGIAKHMNTEDKNVNTLTKSIDSVKVLDLGDCDESVKKELLEDINKLNLKGYEEMVKVNDDGEKVLILTKNQKDRIREILILNASLTDAAIVLLKGSILQSDLEQMVSDYTK